ncbi:19223_t:CDS:2 [Cetraspora pellucida]|uniref:19223_t:CDS:1 n=1 Tax=Cetraspora pellucida TaxID=1433469 RepID=A0A9N9EEE0_9GLOM|nr:19223_t:CDS:2 [Cetraspora pellucida]
MSLKTKEFLMNQSHIEANSVKIAFPGLQNGASHRIVALDEKKHLDSEYIAFEFHTKSISTIGIDHKLLVCELHAVEGRIEKEKIAPGLTFLNLKFQWIFEEMGFNIYVHCELIEIEESEKTEAKKAAENWHFTVNELIEIMQDVYWRVEKRDNLSKLEHLFRNCICI